MLVCSILKNTKPGETPPDLPANAGEASIANLDKMRHANGDIPTAELRLQMQKTMQKHAAVFRRGDILAVSHNPPASLLFITHRLHAAVFDCILIPAVFSRLYGGRGRATSFNSRSQSFKGY